MHLVLVGLSHHRAPIAVRERITCPEHKLNDALAHLSGSPGVREAIILSTCNRMEVYALIEGADLGAAYGAVCRHLSSFHNIPEIQFDAFLYRKAEHDAVAHLLRVASGLDSLVLGEAQIIGQVRTALRSAHAAGVVGGTLSHLFQQALNSGKRVQQETGLSRGAFSIGHAAVDLAARIFDLSEATVMILGAGKMSTLAAKHLVASGVRYIMVANRTHHKAVSMAASLGGTAVDYDDFPQMLAKADIVIASTAAPHPVIRRDTLTPVLKKRRGRPLFLIDIAVPRDVDEDVAELDNVFLYNIDHLQEAVADRVRGRATEAVEAEKIVADEAIEFLNWYRAREAAPIIKQLRGRLDDYARKRLEIMRPGLSSLTEKEWSHIELHISSLMDEVAREPILRMKRASKDAAVRLDSNAEQVRYDLLSAAREIFGLGVEDQATDSESVVDSHPMPATQNGTAQKNGVSHTIPPITDVRKLEHRS